MSALPASPLPVLRGAFTEAHATRLLWRAGFGPRRGQAAELAARGLDGAVAWLTRPSGPPVLHGPQPTDGNGAALDPVNVWGHDHCWWLDRMVRSDQSLIERMTLVWHSWFATSLETSSASLMLAQNRTMRTGALGGFPKLLLELTRDPAMLLWLNGTDNSRWSPNENYAREMMELFTLGADRGAYTQRDVHEQARALTGFTNDWSMDRGPTNFRYDARLHDPGIKTIFGRRGRFGWRDACRFCVTHPLHASFFVAKLWGYFVAEPASASDARALARLYVRTGGQVRPVIEAILRHPALLEGPRMVIPPVVANAGLLRAVGRGVDTEDWGWIAQQYGQRLFMPPNVAGWDYGNWLDTSRWAGRFTTVSYVLRGDTLDPHKAVYSAVESPAEAVRAALAYWGDPALSATTRASLLAFSRRVGATITEDWMQVKYRVLRQNALRALISTTPDAHTC